MDNKSLNFRKSGNSYFFSASQDGVGSTIRLSRFKEAINCYQQAINCSNNLEDKASAAKNTGVVSKKLANLMVERKESKSDCYYYFNLAVNNFDLAYCSASCKSDEWTSDLLSKFHELLQDIVTYYTTNDQFEFNEMINSLENYLQSFQYCFPLRCDLCIEIAQLRFNYGMAQLSDKDFRACLYQMKECYKPIEEAKKYGNELEHIMQEVRILETDIFLHECICRSHQARIEGDSLLEKYIKGDEKLDMNMVWTVVDLYKEAIILTRENDPECEAIALSRLGSIFDKVLKEKYRAKPYMMRSIQLAMSLHPRTFDSDKWFLDARETLSRYQQEAVKQEDEAWNKEKQTYLDQLKDELKLINDERAKGHTALLKYIYAKHPPKWKAGLSLPDTLPDPKAFDYCVSAWKPIFKNAVVHYHTDRVDVERDGKLWKALCEEILKILTGIYESMK